MQWPETQENFEILKDSNFVQENYHNKEAEKEKHNSNLKTKKSLEMITIVEQWMEDWAMVSRYNGGISRLDKA